MVIAFLATLSLLSIVLGMVLLLVNFFVYPLISWAYVIPLLFGGALVWGGAQGVEKGMKEMKEEKEMEEEKEMKRERAKAEKGGGVAQAAGGSRPHPCKEWGLLLAIIHDRPCPAMPSHAMPRREERC